MAVSKEETLWSGIALRTFINTASHSIEYAKVLMQIGYEPLPPRPTTTLFRQPTLGLPNIFQYIGYIKSVDGFTGCYRGVVPRLCAHTISAIAVQKTSQRIVFADEPENVDDDDDDEVWDKRYIYAFIRSFVSRTVGILASHPLDVIAWRMMAQFVGGETKYNGLFRSFVEVYRENGIMGYYAGVVPRLIGNAITLVICSSATYFMNKYLIKDREIRNYATITVRFLATSVTYPFLVVSCCMGVNNCGLVAGRPPQAPIYDNWLDCWAHLSALNQLKRGNSLLWRYYVAPKGVITGPNADNFYVQRKKQE